MLASYFANKVMHVSLMNMSSSDNMIEGYMHGTLSHIVIHGLLQLHLS